jgi:transposase-like protein
MDATVDTETGSLKQLPQTLQEAILYYADPDNCLMLLTEVRWPNGVTCPRCDSKSVTFMNARRIWNCKGCRKQFSIKVGTIFEDSPIGLDKWLAAVWMITNDKNGISSYEIHRALGVTQKTAWFMLHRIRLAMQNGSIEKLAGEVEADETFIGGKEKNKHSDKKTDQGRGTVGKAVVMGILERGGEDKPSKVRTKVVKNTRRETLQGEVIENVEAGSALYTDALVSYQGLNTCWLTLTSKPFALTSARAVIRFGS